MDTHMYLGQSLVELGKMEKRSNAKIEEGIRNLSKALELAQN